MRSDELDQYAEQKGHEDVAAIKKHIPWLFRLGSNREMRRLLDHLHEDELVLAATTGKYAGGRGLIALTDSRLIVTYDGYIRSASEDFPLEHVTSIEWNKKLLRGRIVVFSAGNEVEIKNVYYGGREVVLKARTSMRKVKNQVEQAKREQAARRSAAPVYAPMPPSLAPSADGRPVISSPSDSPVPASLTPSQVRDATVVAQLEMLDELVSNGHMPFSAYEQARADLLRGD